MGLWSSLEKNKELLSSLRDRAADVAQVTGKKVEEAYGSTKIKLMIADKQSQVRTLFKELGELVYENSKKEEPDMEAVEDKMAEIDLVYAAISELQAEERSMKNLLSCPGCGSEIPEDAKFCPNCGSEI